MSLINDALRKARQAASEHDAKQPDGAFRPAKAYPSRRSGRGGGPLAVALIAVAAGVIGASAGWWYFGDRQTPSTRTEARETRANDDRAPVVAPTTQPTQVADRSESESDESPVEAAPIDAGPADSVAAAKADPLPTPIESAAPAAVTKGPVAAPDGERIYVLEAELGYASLSLGYIIARRNNPFAEINGIEVRVGSDVEGFVVEAIEANRVVLRDDKGSLVLRVP